MQILQYVSTKQLSLKPEPNPYGEFPNEVDVFNYLIIPEQAYNSMSFGPLSSLYWQNKQRNDEENRSYWISKTTRSHDQSEEDETSCQLCFR